MHTALHAMRGAVCSCIASVRGQFVFLVAMLVRHDGGGLRTPT